LHEQGQLVFLYLGNWRLRFFDRYLVFGTLVPRRRLLIGNCLSIHHKGGELVWFCYRFGWLNWLYLLSLLGLLLLELFLFLPKCQLSRDRIDGVAAFLVFIQDFSVDCFGQRLLFYLSLFFDYVRCPVLLGLSKKTLEFLLCLDHILY